MHVLKMMSDKGDLQETRIVIVLFLLMEAEKTWSLWHCTGFINLFTVCMRFVAEASHNITF